MNTDYKNAARRNYEDAEILFNRLRWANADQLYGLAAECGLKAVMVGLGARTKSRGDLKKHSVHINKLWNEFITFANGRNGAQYVAYLSNNNPFQDWDVSQRYAKTSEFHHRGAPPHPRVTPHQSAASTIVKKILQQAQSDGLNI